MTRRTRNLGSFHVLSDAILVDVLLTFLGPKDLLQFQVTSPVFHTFCNEESLWRALWAKHHGIESQNLVPCCPGCTDPRHAAKKNRKLAFRGNWKAVVLRYQEGFHFLSIQRSDFTSEYLYARWQESNCDISTFAPRTVVLDAQGRQIQRIDVRQVTKDEFTAKYDLGSLPVVLDEHCTRVWPARKRWTKEHIQRIVPESALFEVSHTEVIAEGKDLVLSLHDYIRYADIQRDQVPLYIFDEHFDEKVPSLAQDYDVSTLKYFAEDISRHLLESSKRRFRWLVMGPARTGAPWHVDPKGSSAWNALLIGRKRWAMYPPAFTPPGIQVVVDGLAVEREHSELTSLQWFSQVYPHLEPDELPLEVVQEPGEVVFIPHGWWHVVLNLEFTVSVTHNFVNRNNIVESLVECVGAHGPQVLGKILRRLEKPLQAPWIEEQHKLVRRFVNLTQFHLEYGFGTPAEFIMSFRDVDLWKYYVAKVLEAHELPEWANSAKGTKSLTVGMNPVFMAGPYVVKFFSPYRGDDFRNLSFHKANSLLASNLMVEFQTELSFLSDVEAFESDSNMFPNILAAGMLGSPSHSVWPWPYLVCNRIGGVSMKELECFRQLNNQIASGSCGDVMDLSPGQVFRFLKPALERKKVSYSIGFTLSHLHSQRHMSNTNKLMQELHLHCGRKINQMNSSKTTVLKSSKALHLGPVKCCPYTTLPMAVPELYDASWKLYVHFLRHQRDYRLSSLWHTLGTFSSSSNTLLGSRAQRTETGDQEGEILRLPTLLLSQMESYVTEDVTNLLPHHRHLPSVLHGDLQIQNILISDSSAHLIDFEDCLIGDPCFDLVALYVSAFRCQRDLFVEFVGAYLNHPGALRNPLGELLSSCQEGSVESRQHFLYVMMCLTLLHPCDAMGNVLKWKPQVTDASTWGELAQILWEWW